MTGDRRVLQKADVRVIVLPEQLVTVVGRGGRWETVVRDCWFMQRGGKGGVCRGDMLGHWDLLGYKKMHSKMQALCGPWIERARRAQKLPNTRSSYSLEYQLQQSSYPHYPSLRLYSIPFANKITCDRNLFLEVQVLVLSTLQTCVNTSTKLL